MAVDCVSSADNLAWGMITIRSAANKKAARVFTLRVLLPQFLVASRLATLAELLCCFDIAPRPAGDVLLLVECQLTPDFGRRPEHERAWRRFHPPCDKRVCADR